MCGRFALRLARDEIRQVPGHDEVDVDDWIDEDEFIPRYNIAPRTYAPVLRRRDVGDRASDSLEQASRSAGPSQSQGHHAGAHYVLHSMKWGLVPHWSKFEDKTLSTTNARSENLVEGGGMWASIKGKKRCAVVCQGYYEWLTKGKEKLPHFTKYREDKLMLLAGLYDRVVLEGQTQPLWTFTIVTTDANKEFSWLHDRQPVILSTRTALHAWLDTSKQGWTPELSQLVKPYGDASNPLECYQVPKEVGKVGTESASFIEPIANRKDGIQAMFSKQASKSSAKFPQTLQTSKAKASLKRSRSPSPLKIHDLTSQSPSKNKSKQDDGDSDALDVPATPKKHKSGSSSQKLARTKRKPPKEKPKPKADTGVASNQKLTSFFQKT